MIQTVLSILGSVRFWILTLTAVLGILHGQPAVEVIQIWLGAVAALGTLDSVANKIGGETTNSSVATSPSPATPLTR